MKTHYTYGRGWTPLECKDVFFGGHLVEMTDPSQPPCGEENEGSESQ